VRPVRGAGNLMSRLSRQCGIINISQAYRPARPDTGIALYTYDTERSVKAASNYEVYGALSTPPGEGRGRIHQSSSWHLPCPVEGGIHLSGLLLPAEHTRSTHPGKTAAGRPSKHNLLSSPNIIRRMMATRMSWTGRVARMGDVVGGKAEGRRPPGRPRRRWVGWIS
jgi:hypothetical protein